MGFWSKLGKIALKIAPYAAMAIPGVGVPLGMAISGGLSAAEKKASGGSWKDALISGGVGAGTSLIGSKIPGLDKIGGKVAEKATDQAGSFVAKDIADVAAKAAGKGIAPSIGTIAKKFGTDTATNILGSLATRQSRPEGTGTAVPPPVQTAIPATPTGRPDLSPTGPLLRNMRRTMGPTTGVEDQRNPNLALALGQGTQDALRNQPYNPMNQAPGMMMRKKKTPMMAAM